MSRFNRNSQRGFSQILAMGAAALVASLIGILVLNAGSGDAALEAEARMDLKLVSDRIQLALASEDECRTVFTAAPLNGLTFTEDDQGKEAMDFTAPFVVRGITLATLNQRLTGSSINKLWLSNDIIHPAISGLKHYRVKFNIQATTGGAFSALTKESFDMGVLVDGANRIQYCYLGESVAIKTCQAAGGYFDPLANPRCRFNFTGRECADTNSCLSGLDQEGDLICSNRMEPPPPPPPPPEYCYCNGSCNQTWLGPQGVCGWYAVMAANPAGECHDGDPDGCFRYLYSTDQGWSVGDPMPGLDPWMIDAIVDATMCVQAPEPPTGCVW